MSSTQLLLLGAVSLAALLLLIVGSARRREIIYAPDVGLLYKDGQFERLLEPGRHQFIDLAGRTKIVRVNLAPQPLSQGEITVVSADQFSFKLGLTSVVRVTDARLFHEAKPRPGGWTVAMTMPPARSSQHATEFSSAPDLSALVANAALQAAASLPLKDIVARPTELSDQIRAGSDGQVAGAAIKQVLVTSITLPPETRRMFTDVERARQEALASLERARGEQASLRALANAARLIAGTPALANLRFLQTLEQTPGPKTIVLGQNLQVPEFGAPTAPRADKAS